MGTLMQEIRDVINRHSREGESDTPDYILARFMMDCLFAFETAVNERADWYASKHNEVPTVEADSNLEP